MQNGHFQFLFLLFSYYFLILIFNTKNLSTQLFITLFITITFALHWTLNTLMFRIVNQTFFKKICCTTEQHKCYIRFRFFHTWPAYFTYVCLNFSRPFLIMLHKKGHGIETGFVSWSYCWLTEKIKSFFNVVT